MTLESAINRFLQYLSSERNLAPRTVEAYGYDLRRFRVHLEGDGPPRRIDKVDPYDLKDYLAVLRDEHDCRPATLCRVISSLRVFFDYATTEGFIRTNPARGLRNPKRAKKLPVYLTPDEAGRMLSHQDLESKEPLRDETILLVLTMAGIRLEELVSLDIDNLDFETGAIRVFGKGRKERLVPMNRTLHEGLQRWVAERPSGWDGTRALFLASDGSRISRRTVQYVVKKAAKALGLDPRLSPHKLRHTFATALYGEAVELRDIQELLGHADISSTSIYTHTNVDKVRAAVNKLKM